MPVSIRSSAPRASRRQRWAAVALFVAASWAYASPAAAQGGRVALPDFASLVERVAPAVVNIRTTERAAEGPRAPFRRPSPQQPPGDDAPRGEGSGFLLSGDGYVMTNAHVLDNASEVLVTLADKREFKARIIGADERSDVALVKIDAEGLPSVKIGDVKRLRVGDWVLAIGSPFGLDSTVTAGIVSAKQRETGSDIAFLQTDVAVNPGNSGGPLIDTRGEVIGINSQILSPVGSYIGISFAIPIDEAVRIVAQLRAGGRVVRGYLGIQPVDVSREMAEEYGLAVGQGRARGAFVRQVIAGTPGEKAGVQPGDVVLAVDGKPVEGAVDLRRRLGGYPPGTTVRLQINRRGKVFDLSAVLGDVGQQVAAIDRAGPAPTEPLVSSAARHWGLAVMSVPPERQTPGVSGGVQVSAASDGAEAVGLRTGDLILGVGNSDVADLKEFDALVAARDKTRALPITVRRGNVAMFLRIPAGN
ncbi:MAG: Do family serine endopeptidase [Piscinibacter sp.]|nr:Do family serine endopeptidase [Piscinibacter sp.]